MKLSEIAKKIESLDPNADIFETARTATLMATSLCDHEELSDDEFFCNLWKEIGFRLSAASDQHSAVTQELQELSNTDPREFTRDQIWVLIRAIKIQSQLLRLYIGDSTLNFC